MKTLRQYLESVKIHGGIGHYKDVSDSSTTDKPKNDEETVLNIHGGIGHYKDPSQDKDEKDLKEAVEQSKTDPKHMEGYSDFIKKLPTRTFQHSTEFYLDKKSLDHSENQAKTLRAEHTKHLQTNAKFEHQMALKQYTGHAYGDLNKSLNRGSKMSKDSADLHDRLQQFFKSNTKPLSKDLKVWSGLKPPTAKNLAKNIHKTKGVFHMPAYLSTSLDLGIANEFSHSDNKGHRHLLKVHLPAGYKNGHYIDGISHHKGEKEYLLNAGQKMKVIGHDIHQTKETKWAKAYTHHVWHVTPV